MIKINSGLYKGRKLKNFKNNKVRPTQSRVKKSIMDTLNHFEGKTVLDLFSGVGSLGIETLSRGSEFVCFVEKDYKVVNILESNLSLLGINDSFEIIASDVIRFLKSSKKEAIEFSIHFINSFDKSCPNRI